MFGLAQHAALHVSGRDATAFLQSQMSSDLAGLASGAWQWSGVLNIQGRVLHFLLLWRTGDDRYALIGPTSLRPALQAHLSRYVLRAKVTLAISSESVVGNFDDVGNAEAIRLPGRSIWLTDAIVAPASDLEQVRWLRADVDDRLPWLTVESSGKHLAQSLGLDKLGALSLKKGCYPGQEIVARLHYKGQTKRRIVRIRVDHASVLGTAVVQITDRKLCGELLNFTIDDGALFGLAIIEVAAQESALGLLADDGAVLPLASY